MSGKKSKQTEVKKVKPGQTGNIEVILDEALLIPDGPLFVSDNEKIERVKATLKQERIAKDKQLVDYWLRHELQLGTVQIKKMWKKMDEIYRV